VTIGIFETTKTTKQTLIVNLSNLLDFLGLRKKIITFVKNEGVNLNVMTSAPRFIMNCDILRLEESFKGMGFFPRHVNMGLLKRKFTKTWDSCN
jgi:hypothetical protein